MSDAYGSGSQDNRFNITATVKWYNSTKGFGFVQVDPGEPDVFIHASAVSQGGFGDLPNGATIECDIIRTDRGLQVSRLHKVDASTAEQPSYGGGGGGPRPSRDWQESYGDEQETDGTVKFFDTNRGFGFVVPDDGDRDIFLPGRILTKAGIARLESNQRVRIRWREGDRGPLATWVDLA